jgi:hypothetical protein
MIQAYSWLFQHKVVDADNAITRAMTMALHKWWQLPDVGASPHVLLLQVRNMLRAACAEPVYMCGKACTLCGSAHNALALTASAGCATFCSCS